MTIHQINRDKDEFVSVNLFENQSLTRKPKTTTDLKPKSYRNVTICKNVYANYVMFSKNISKTSHIIQATRSNPYNLMELKFKIKNFKKIKFTSFHTNSTTTSVNNHHPTVNFID